MLRAYEAFLTKKGAVGVAKKNTLGVRSPLDQ